MKNSNRSPGTITLIGSGEMSPSMGKVHRAVMSRITGPVRAVFLDTPAGFELNADHISARAVQYFKQHLNLDLAVASFKAAAAARPVAVENALRKLRRANYIFAGPGSPTYAIRNWRETPILAAMVQRLATGAHLVFASAAAIAIGRYTLPVYEIYKVGEDPHWVEGLDLLRPYGLELAIIPHWNNAEGGTHDTRYCFMGEPRMGFLEESLPDSATVLGIDEYTACIIDLGSGECQVIGAGQVTIRHGGRETAHPASTTFALDRLTRRGDPRGRPAAPEPEPAWSKWLDVLEPDRPEDEEDEDEDERADETVNVAPFIDLLVWVRAQLRAAKQWEPADEIRRRLSELGIILEDGPTDTTWRTSGADRS